MEKKSNLFIASDHAGFKLKEKVCAHLKKNEFFSLNDLGPQNEDRVDYPDFADKVCVNVNSKPNNIGILICGSGQGVAIRANKYPYIRAALCWNDESSKLSKAHNDANVLCLPARFITEDQAFSIINTFLTTDFEGGRHSGRVEKIHSELKQK